MYYVHDMKKSVQYYQEMLNLTPEEESSQWTTFNLNGHRICLHATEANVEINGHGVLIASVTNLEEMTAEMKKRGVEIVKDIHQVCENGFAVDIKDPSGNLLSFFEYRG